MNRKPIFDAVRIRLGRGFTQAEVDALDAACDLAEAAVPPGKPVKIKPPVPAAPAPGGHLLGKLSEEFESSGRGPGTVSGGQNDSGGVSYGVYQLSSVAGTCANFLKVEGKAWAAKFSGMKPGSPAFSAAWKKVADSDPEAFRAAQHAFIERTHYRKVVAEVAAAKGFDLDSRHNAVRDATWSVSVQHGGACTILIAAVNAVDSRLGRDDFGYDRTLVEAIYKCRTEYVLHVAADPKKSEGVRQQLVSITQKRYPAELAKALAMFASAPAAPAPAAPAPATTGSNGTIDGKAVALQNGVDVKSTSVKLSKLHAKMEAAIVAVAQAAKVLGLPKAVITSGNDSKHKDDSLHYKSQALDFRANNIAISVGEKFRDEIAKILGQDYDVLFETFMVPANNHIHIEYDPK